VRLVTRACTVPGAVCITRRSSTTPETTPFERLTMDRAACRRYFEAGAGLASLRLRVVQDGDVTTRFTTRRATRWRIRQQTARPLRSRPSQSLPAAYSTVVKIAILDDSQTETGKPCASFEIAGTCRLCLSIFGSISLEWGRPPLLLLERE